MEISATHVPRTSTLTVPTKRTLANSQGLEEPRSLGTEPEVRKKRRRRNRRRGLASKDTSTCTPNETMKEECVSLQEQTSVVTTVGTISAQMKPDIVSSQMDPDIILTQTQPTQETMFRKQIMEKPAPEPRDTVPKVDERKPQEEKILAKKCNILQQPASIETSGSSHTVPTEATLSNNLGQIELASVNSTTKPEDPKKRRRRRRRLAQRLRNAAAGGTATTATNKTTEEEGVLQEQNMLTNAVSVSPQPVSVANQTKATQGSVSTDNTTQMMEAPTPETQQTVSKANNNTKKPRMQNKSKRRRKETFLKWCSLLQQTTLDTSAAKIPSVAQTVSIEGILDSQRPGKEQALEKPKIESKEVELSGAAEDQGSKILSAIKRQEAVMQNDPTIPLGTKPKSLPKKIRKALCIPEDESYDQILNNTTEEIVTEMQAKYPGLINVSKKTGHKLLQEVGKKIYIRAKELADSNEEASQSCFTLSRGYRRAHPHFGDFQLILSTLHGLQDAIGVPRTQLQETDLSSLPPVPPILNLTSDKIKSACARNAQHIVNKMKEHINSVQSEILSTDSEEEIARKQVRCELKKFSPYLHMIVDQVLRKHFLPADGPYYRMRIYGEPFLPGKDIMNSFLYKYKPVHVTRSTRMYNLLKFNVPPAQYHLLMAMNGTVLSGAKLIIRSSDIANYIYRLNKDNSGEQEASQVEDIPMEQDQLENWDEEL